MRLPLRVRHVAVMALGAWLLFSSFAAACSVPVFRYALERWPPDRFRAVVFHRGELTPEQVKIIDAIDEATGLGREVNLDILAVDLDDSPPASLARFVDEKEPLETPRVSLLTPDPRFALRPDRQLWSGALDAKSTGEKIAELSDSPLRKKIASDLLGGTTAVWVCLESGDKKKDDEAFARLEKHLRALEKELKLPAEMTAQLDGTADSLGTIDPVDELQADVPLKIAFSTVRVARKDAKEAVLVDQLLHCEEDLLELEGPMALPVFGRGRVLWALVGAGINEETIRETCEFLVGACSCQIKAQNPGVDLLLTADWDAALDRSYASKEIEIPPLAGLEGFVGSATPDAPKDGDGNGDGDGEDTVAATATPVSPDTTPNEDAADAADEPEPRAEAMTVAPPADAAAATTTEPLPDVTAEADEKSAKSGSLTRNIIVVAGVGIAILLIASFLVRRK